MIKFVVTANSLPTTTHSFDCDSIILGCQHSTFADLTLPGDLREKHLLISRQLSPTKTTYTITNLAHDPFITLNGFAFGKRPLNHQDIIQIGETTLQIEIPVIQLQPKIHPPSSKQIESPPIPSLSQQEIESLFLQVEALLPFSTPKPSPSTTIPASSTPPIVEDSSVEHALPLPPASPAPTTALPSSQNEDNVELESTYNSELKLNDGGASSAKSATPKLSLKDYYLSEYDEDNDFSPLPQVEHTPLNPLNSSKSFYWSGGVKILSSLVGIVIILLGLVYLWISDQSNDEEIRASRSIADVAMALTYAQTKHIHPQNQNWSDPEFIRNTLTPVLSPDYPSLAEFDRHGQFTTSPYILRIYTSSNLAQFLVIAQPIPSLLHWLVPKATVIIDSLTMEVRKVKDLKALNRLLVSTTTVESAHANEISALVKQGELITLANLTDKKDNFGFSPPRALGLIHPNSENLVYNAPRYYLFGQAIIKKAVDLVDKPQSPHEITLFQQELAALVNFPNLILYSTDGLEHTLQSQKALNTLAPHEKFLMAYLQLNSKGRITSSHLLMDDSVSEVIAENTPETTGIAYQSVFNTPFTSLQENPSSLAEQLGIDPRDPLYLRLSALVNARQQILKPISDEMIDLLNKQTQNWLPTFMSRFSKLQLQYMNANKEQRLNTALDLGAIARDTNHLPASRLIEYIKATELEHSFQDYLTSLKQHPSVHRLPADEIENQLKQLDGSSTWHELEQNITHLATILNFENVPDIERLVAYQNAARIQVVQKLNAFLLSTESPLPKEAFMPEYRQSLMTILETAWIMDPDTYSFYIGEFDLHASQKL